MSWKTFFWVLGGLGVFFALVALFYANRTLLGEPFAIWPSRFIPLYAVLFLTFLAGLILTLSLSVVRESRHFLERWKDNRTRREAQAVDDLYARGVEAMLDGRSPTALEHFRAVLARAPRRVDALLKAGEVLRHQGRIQEALELHERAHKAAPDDIRPLYEMVADADARDDTAAARLYLERIITLKPRGAFSALRHLRDLHMEERGWDKALELQERLEKIRPPDEDAAADTRAHLGIRYELAARAADRGRTKEALSQLRRLLKDAPGFVPAWRKLGQVRRMSGDDDGAVATWVEGYEKTKAPVLLTTLEDHFLSREHPERAIECFRHAVAIADPDTVPRFYLGKLFYRLEMLDEALAEFGSLQDRAAYTPTLSYYLAKIHERRGRWAEANSHYRRIVLEGRLLSSQFRCLTCDQMYDSWVERCQRCGEWNRIEVDFKEDVSLEDLGISTAPVYSAPRS